jgi:hypothetical protein
MGNLHERQSGKAQLSIGCCFTDQIEQLLAKMETLQAEIDSLYKVNMALQEPCGNVPRIMLDDEGNIVVDKKDAGAKFYLHSSPLHQS